MLQPPHASFFYTHLLSLTLPLTILPVSLLPTRPFSLCPLFQFNLHTVPKPLYREECLANSPVSKPNDKMARTNYIRCVRRNQDLTKEAHLFIWTDVIQPQSINDNWLICCLIKFNDYHQHYAIRGQYSCWQILVMSGGMMLLKTPRTKLRTMGDRAFCSSAPNLWNALPVHLRTPQPVNAFKRGLKTYLFSKAFE